MSERSFEDQIKEYSSKANEQLILIKSHTNQNYEFVHTCIKNYVNYKFMLDNDECPSEVILELSEHSIAKAAKLSRDELALVEVSSGCTDVSTAVTKKVLMLLGIQKTLNIKFPTETTAYIDTISDLAQAILEQLKNNN